MPTTTITHTRAHFTVVYLFYSQQPPPNIPHPLTPSVSYFFQFRYALLSCVGRWRTCCIQSPLCSLNCAASSVQLSFSVLLTIILALCCCFFFPHRHALQTWREIATLAAALSFTILFQSLLALFFPHHCLLTSTSRGQFCWLVCLLVDVLRCLLISPEVVRLMVLKYFLKMMVLPMSTGV